MTDRTKSVLMLVSNPAVSTLTGWPVGFWWAELSHPYWEFTLAGYEVTIASPDGGKLEADAFSDPRHESGYSREDLLSLGFLSSPDHLALVEKSVPLDDVDLDTHDAIFLVGGQAPMYTFKNDPRVHHLVADTHRQGKTVAIVCHATATLLDTRTAEGHLLVAGKTWTGFANSEEDVADQAVGRQLQPFRIEDEARRLPDTNFIVHGPFASHAVRDGNLITGQQQNSGSAAARLVIEALGRGTAG